MTPDRTIQPNAVLRGLAAVWRLPRMLLVGLARLYQLGISPYFPRTCRYTPTCSQYAILALKEYGAVRGTILSIWRILRCNPWGGHGHDPPAWPPGREKGKRKSAKGAFEIPTGGDDSAQARSLES